MRIKVGVLIRAHIAIFKVQIADPNSSKWAPYWNVLGDQILHFLEFFYYLLSHFENRWSNGFTIWLSHHRISDFQSGLINSKKFQKNVKFGLQAHFNMENMLSWSDQLFELRKLKNELDVFRPPCYRKHISHSFSLYTHTCVCFFSNIIST